MKRLLGFGLCTAAALIFAVGGVASARPLNWEGTLTNNIGDLPDVVASGGGVATVNGSTGAIPAHLNHLRIAASRGAISGTDIEFVTDPETIGNGIVAVLVQAALRTGTIGPISGAIQTTMSPLTMSTLPLGGLAKICLVSTVCTNFLPLILTQPTTMGGTKGVGVGGLITVGGTGIIRISLNAAPWTVKTASAVDQVDTGFTVKTRMGFAHGPASATSTTAQPSGVVQIVSPSQVRTNLALGTNAKIAVFSTLLIHFIPEPGLLLLLGSGVVGLAVLGRSRMRR